MKPITDIAYYTNAIVCIELKNVPAHSNKYDITKHAFSI
jgi:hypothetical protein